MVHEPTLTGYSPNRKKEHAFAKDLFFQSLAAEVTHSVVLKPPLTSGDAKAGRPVNCPWRSLTRMASHGEVANEVEDDFLDEELLENIDAGT